MQKPKNIYLVLEVMVQIMFVYKLFFFPSPEFYAYCYPCNITDQTFDTLDKIRPQFVIQEFFGIENVCNWRVIQKSIENNLGERYGQFASQKMQLAREDALPFNNYWNNPKFSEIIWELFVILRNNSKIIIKKKTRDKFVLCSYDEKSNINSRNSGIVIMVCIQNWTRFCITSCQIVKPLIKLELIDKHLASVYKTHQNHLCHVCLVRNQGKSKWNGMRFP